MDQKELAMHLETLRQALEPLSDLSQITRSSLIRPEPQASSPEQSLHGQAPQNIPSLATPSVTKEEYQAALSDPKIVRALLESGLTQTPLNTAVRPEPSEAFEFERHAPTSLEVELKESSRPIRHGRSSTPILRERPTRDST